MLAVSSLATYGILLAGFYYFKSPSFVWTNENKPIEFQEKLAFVSQFEAKHTLNVNSLKYGRSTTRRLLKKLIIIPRVIGVLDYFLIVPFLRTIYIWYHLAWLGIYFLFFICATSALTLGYSLVYIYGCIVLSIFFSFALLYLSLKDRSSCINKSSNKVSFCNTRSKLSGVKFSTTFSNSFKRFYSTNSGKDKLIINSTFNNINFVDNKSILLISSLNGRVKLFDNAVNLGNLEFNTLLKNLNHNILNFDFELSEVLYNLGEGKFCLSFYFYYLPGDSICATYTFDFLDKNVLNCLECSYGYIRLYEVDLDLVMDNNFTFHELAHDMSNCLTIHIHKLSGLEPIDLNKKVLLVITKIYQNKTPTNKYSTIIKEYSQKKPYLRNKMLSKKSDPHKLKFVNKSFKRFYSTNSVYPLKNVEFKFDPYLLEPSSDENIDNSHKDLNVEDLKALHSLFTKDLFKDRIAPVVPFDSNLILVSCNLSDDNERSKFLKEWGSKGGIYILEYIHNPLIYYIGRTTLFKRRINNHIKAETRSKFHIFLKLVGLEYFKFSIIEICSPGEQGIRENYYLQKFLPILNTTFSSSFSESAIYTGLTEKITSLKSTTLTQKSNQPISIYIYTLCKDKGINPTYVKYNSISETSKMERIAYGTVLLFRDTNVPFRGKLYFTKAIVDFNSTLDKVNNILKDVKLISNIAQKVWVYDAKTLDLITGSPFQSKLQASNTMGISRRNINYSIDTKKPEGVKGTYLFSKPLKESEIKSLRELSEDIRIGNKVKVWAYDALNMDLINNEPFSSIFDAAKYFNVNYRTVNRHLDTKLITKQNKMSVYFFKKEISLNLKIELMKHVDKFHYVRSEIWAYKFDELGKLKLLPSQPFKTKREAVRKLHMHNTVINKYIDTGVEYKGLLLYSTPQNL